MGCFLFFFLHRIDDNITIAGKKIPTWQCMPYPCFIKESSKRGEYIYLSIKKPCKSCIICLGIKGLSSFKSADQGEAGNGFCPPWVGGMGSREQWPERGEKSRRTKTQGMFMDLLQVFSISLGKRHRNLSTNLHLWKYLILWITEDKKYKVVWCYQYSKKWCLSAVI